MINVIHKGKSKTFSGVDEMLTRLKFNHIDDATRSLIERAGKRGDSVFVTNNPLISEMSMGEQISVLAAATQEDLDRTFYGLRDDI